MIKQLCICMVYDHFVNEDDWGESLRRGRSTKSLEHIGDVSTVGGGECDWLE